MFKWLFGKSKGDTPEFGDHQAIYDNAIRRMMEQTKSAVRLTFTPGSPVPDAPVSSIGGRPSLRSAEDWPRDAKGNAMTFLAQLNYADLPKLEGYPTSGLLSFFVMDDDLFGSDLPSIGGDGFRVIWETDPSGLVRIDQPDMAESYSPFGLELEKNGAPLRGSLADGPPMPVSAVAQQIISAWPKGYPTALEDAFAERLADAKPGTLYYGAHPDFTQQDFRVGERAAYSEVLLQIGIVTPDRHGWQIMFGDAGEAQFMITPEDLKARRFDRVAWNWDCC